MTNTQLLKTYLRPQRKRVVTLAFLLLVTIGLPLAGPQFLREFIDAARGKESGFALLWPGLAYIVMGLSSEGLFALTFYLSEKVGWTATNRVRLDLLDHVLGLDMAFHNSRTPGEIIERVDGDVTALSKFFSLFVVNILGSVLLLAGIVLLTLRESVLVGTVLAVLATISLVGMSALRRMAVKHSIAELESSAGLFGFIEERLAGAEDIRALGAGSHVMRGLARALRPKIVSARRSESTGMLVWVAEVILMALMMVAVLGLAGWQFMRGHITLGTVFLLYQYQNMIDEPLSTIAGQLKEFQKASAGLVRIRELLSERSSISSGPVNTLPSPPSLSLENVSFEYDAGDPVLRNVSFRLAPGEVLGVIGRTGSGKTTLARLIMRLYDCTSGRVLLGSTDVRELSLPCLRSAAVVVTQDVQIFEGTVRDNLTLFDNSISLGRVEQVLRELGLDRWASEPDSEIASGGTKVSAGEAQLLAFARAFLRDPGLVILDEASSRLDPATEAVLNAAVDKLLAHRTAVVIAHKLSTVARTDWICVMDSGSVVEFGRPDDLAADPDSVYSRLTASAVQGVLA